MLGAGQGQVTDYGQQMIAIENNKNNAESNDNQKKTVKS